MIYFSVLFNYCFFPSLLLFCSFLFLLYACARQTRYQELAVALDSSNLTNKQLVTKIEELVRNNPTNQFDIVFAAPPRSLGVCKVTGSLIVHKEGCLHSTLYGTKWAGWKTWEDQSLRPLVSVVAHLRKQKQNFVVSIYVWSLDLLTLSLDDKHPHKTAISGPGLNPWNREFWCWQQCENLFLQVVMLF